MHLSLSLSIYLSVNQSINTLSPQTQEPVSVFFLLSVCLSVTLSSSVFLLLPLSVLLLSKCLFLFLSLLFLTVFLSVSSLQAFNNYLYLFSFFFVCVPLV